MSTKLAYSFSASLADFQENMIALYGERGKKWLAELPQHVQAFALQWGLSDLKPTEHCFYNYVLAGMQGERPIILKMGLDVQELTKEVRALKAFEGPSAARVLEYEIGSDQGALLIERAIPGTTLHPTFPERDDTALEIVCTLIQRLSQPPVSEHGDFRAAADWLGILDKAWDIPPHYLDHARILRDQLLATAPAPTLVHGDLHHGNIVQHGTDYLAIDPKGVIGEPAYEIVVFICNPYEKLFLLPNWQAIMKRRIFGAAKKLNVDPERIQRWCFIQAVLAWTWFLEDGIETSEIARITNMLDPLTPMDLTTSSKMLQD